MEEEKKDEGTQGTPPTFDWSVLGVSEFKGEETISELKQLLEKGKTYDDVAPYKDKFEQLNSYVEVVSDPTKFFADGVNGLKREQLRMKYPNVSVDIASKISNNDGSDLSPLEAMAIAEHLRSGGKTSVNTIMEIIKEENNIDDLDELDDKTKARLEMKARSDYEYIKSINADVQLPDVQPFTEYVEKRRGEQEAIVSQLSKAWTEVTPDLKGVVKSTPIAYEGKVEVDGAEIPYSVPVELTDEDLQLVDTLVGEMSKSKQAPTKEVMATIGEMVVNNALKHKMPDILTATARQVAEAVKMKYMNPQLPRAEDKPKGTEQVGMTDDEKNALMSFMNIGLGR